MQNHKLRKLTLLNWRRYASFYRKRILSMRGSEIHGRGTYVQHPGHGRDVQTEETSSNTCEGTDDELHLHIQKTASMGHYKQHTEFFAIRELYYKPRVSGSITHEVNIHKKQRHSLLCPLCRIGGSTAVEDNECGRNTKVGERLGRLTSYTLVSSI